MPNHKSLFDVLRRLLMVFGCVVLATTQPMSIFASTAQPDTQRSPETVIYPKASQEKTVDSPVLRGDSGFGGGYYMFIVLVLAAAGGWILWRRRSGEAVFSSRIEKKLQIEETRSLGNRQFLVVASYEGRKFLLGVTTERIQMLTELSRQQGEGGAER